MKYLIGVVVLLAIVGGASFAVVTTQGHRAPLRPVAPTPHRLATSTSPSSQPTPTSATTKTTPTNSTSPAVSKTTTPSASQPTAPSTASTLNLAAIPLGDGKVSTSPKAGYEYSCTTSFRGGGASHSGDWINGSFWDLAKKISVEGHVMWPSATFSATVSGNTRTLAGNGLPVDEPTGIFPIQQSDPAYQYDRNPNTIQANSFSIQIPAHPIFASTPSCVPMGPIGYALDGVAIYNALDASGRDAVAHEVQDACDGHPQSGGQYHYHGPSPCMPNSSKPNTVVGYALDGFPITSMYKANGTEYTNTDLGACHGMTSTITLPNGSTERTYHYVLTQEYPYTIGCFRGTPVHDRAPTAGAATPNRRG